MALLVNLLAADETGPVWADWDGPQSCRIRFDMSHRDTLRITQQAGVSLKRATKPIVTFLRDYKLVDADDLREIFSTERGTLVIREIEEPAWFPLFQEHIQASRELPAGSSGSYLMEEDVIVLNVGAHWNGWELGETMSTKAYLKGYRKMVCLDDECKPFGKFTFVRSRWSKVDFASFTQTSVSSGVRPHQARWIVNTL
jgi:hypothetical protein